MQTGGQSLASPWEIGRNVPWSAAWTGEDRFDVRPSTFFPGYRELIQIERPAAGEPRFRAMHVSRQRAAIVDHLCHVCGRRTPERDRYLFPTDSGSFVPAGGARRYSANVPPVHLACGRRARGLCPHLKGAEARPVAFPSEASVLMPLLQVPPGMERIAAMLPPGPPIAWSVFRLYGAAFSREVSAARAARGRET